MLQARDISCSYGKESILEQLSISLKPGEVFALIGPNGAGKTTLMRALSRLLKPDAGTVILDGKDLWSLKPADVAKQLALAVQQEQRDWALTVEEAVRLGRTPYRGWTGRISEDDQNIIQTAMRQMGIEDLTGREITTLSGGEWRRMILARALAQQPDILLLDEPTAGLDLKYQFEILSLVQQLAHEKKLTVALTLHDLNQAGQYADRIALVSHKRILKTGTPTEVLTAETIQQAYELPVKIIPHPVHETPMVIPVGKRRE